MLRTVELAGCKLVDDVLPIPEESLNSLVLRHPGARTRTSPHLLGDILMSLRRDVNVVRTRRLRPAPLRQRTDGAQHGHEHGEHAVGHVYAAGGLLLRGVPRGVPLLPVLPRGVHGGVAGLVAPRPVGGSELLVGGSFRPADAICVVEVASVGVGEDVVGFDDEAITLEADGGCDGPARSVTVGGFVDGFVVGGVDVGMVQLHELVEAFLGVGAFAGDGEDVVGCWVGGRGPGGRGVIVRRGSWIGGGGSSISSLSDAMLRIYGRVQAAA